MASPMTPTHVSEVNGSNPPPQPIKTNDQPAPSTWTGPPPPPYLQPNGQMYNPSQQPQFAIPPGFPQSGLPPMQGFPPQHQRPPFSLMPLPQQQPFPFPPGMPPPGAVYAPGFQAMYPRPPMAAYGSNSNGNYPPITILPPTTMNMQHVGMGMMMPPPPGMPLQQLPVNVPSASFTRSQSLNSGSYASSYSYNRGGSARSSVTGFTPRLSMHGGGAAMPNANTTSTARPLNDVDSSTGNPGLNVLPPSPSKSALQRIGSSGSPRESFVPRRTSANQRKTSSWMPNPAKPSGSKRPSSGPITSQRRPSSSSAHRCSSSMMSARSLLPGNNGIGDGTAGYGTVSRTASRAGLAQSSPSVVSIPASFPASSRTIPSDDTDNIKVVVRIRPLSNTEYTRGDPQSVDIDPDDSRMMRVSVPGSNGLTATKTFAFHSCLGPETAQTDVLDKCGIPQLLDAVLDGYNATILAYGQTGSGKTFTISGFEDDTSNVLPGGDGEFAGIVPRSVAYLFRQLAKRQGRQEPAASPPRAPPAAEREDVANPVLTSATNPSTPQVEAFDAASSSEDGCVYRVRVSYCEIYNEALYDLLNFDQRQLQIRWDSVKGFHAPDLHCQLCTSAEEVMQMVALGLRHRRVGLHALNLESSRSHSVLTVHVEATPTRQDDVDFGTTRIGKACFVDLAGSERLKDSGSSGSTMRETASINCSLFMLGKVISALASGATGARVPYRESKLTKLLMDSLGGSAMALFIACCSPSAEHSDETLHTLGYAARAKNIKNAPAVQVDPKEAAMSTLRREVRLLRMENAYLREQLLLVNNPPRLPQPEDGTDGTSSIAATPATSPLPIQPAGGRSPGVLPGVHSILLPVPDSGNESSIDSNNAGLNDSLTPAVLQTRLAEAQRLLVSMANENGRLAADNERLRAGKALVANDYTGALQEVDWLKGKLAALLSC